MFLGVRPRNGGMFQYAQSVVEALTRLPPADFRFEFAYVDIAWIPILARLNVSGRPVRCGVTGMRFAEMAMLAGLPCRAARKFGRWLNPLARNLSALNCDYWIFPAQDAMSYQFEGKSIGTIHDLRQAFDAGAVRADLDDVLVMFSSLLRISQIEAHDQTAAFRAIDLGEIVREVVELFDAAAEENGVSLDANGDCGVMINGDRDLLFDALSNLVDNSIKHGRKGGRVSLAVTANDGGATVCVSDDGPGIPVEERQHVFKRFYRLEQSRATSGYGLGLSLVAAVARLHGATIEMLDKCPGLEFRLCFPKVVLSETRDTAE